MAEHTIDMTGFHPLMKDLVAAAIDLGWTAKQEAARGRGPGSVVLHSYDGTVTLRATPVRQINQAKLETMRRKVIRYGDPKKRLGIIAAVEGRAGQRPSEEPTGDQAIERVMPLMPTMAAQIATGRDALTVERSVVSQRPWLARKQPGKTGGTKYESPAVVERVWSDGEVDYICSYEGCGYNAMKPTSVSRHYGAVHSRGVTARTPQVPTVPAHDYFEPTHHRDYRPQQRVVDALADWLTERSWDNTDQLAVLMLTWAHERPDLPDVEPEHRPPDTAEDIIERIRMLVGAPLASRLAEAEAQIEALRLQVAEGEAAGLAKDATIERLREERRALAALMSDEEGVD